MTTQKFIDENKTWTGVFKNEDEADIWYNKHGKKWESEGKKLVRVECGK